MKRFLFSVLLCAATAALYAAPPTTLAIRNARIVPISGPPIANGSVVVRNGLIEAVGENVAIPADAWVLDGAGLTVYPGLIDALSTWGIPQAAPAAAAIVGGRGAAVAVAAVPVPTTPAAPPARGPEDRPNTTPWVNAADLIQPTDAKIAQARSAGFTTAVTFPTTGIVAGEGAVVNLLPGKPADMVVASPAGLYATLTTNGFASFPGSLMGVIAYLWQLNIDLDHYKMQKAAYDRHPAGQKRPDYDRSLEAMLQTPRVLLPAIRKVEIDRMIRFGKEFKRDFVLYGAHEAYRPEAAKEIAQAGIPVLVSLRWPEAARDADPEQEDNLRTLEMRESAPHAPAELAKAKAKFAFYSGGVEQPRDVLKAAKKAVDAGLPHDQAVRAMTLSVAEIYGVNDRLGSIEKGKIANLTITKGDLLDDRSQVQYVLIDGVKYDPVPEAPTPAAGANGRSGVRP